MATPIISFPKSPSNNQEISIDGRKWVYKLSIPGWVCSQIGSGGVVFIASETAPFVNLYKAGDRWFNTSTGIEYVLINDGDDKYWVNVYTTPHNHSISNINGLQTILNLKTQFYYRSTPPSNPNVGDRWMDSSTGYEYIYVYDGTGYQWMQPTVEADPYSGSIKGNTVSVASSSYSMISTDYYVGVDYAGIVTITLPNNPDDGKMVVIKDESGNAGSISRYITIVPFDNTDTIDNDSSAIININNGGVDLIYRNGWRII